MKNSWFLIVTCLFASQALGSLAAAGTNGKGNDPMNTVLERYSRLHADMVTDGHAQLKDDASLFWVAAGKVNDKELSSKLQDAAKKLIGDSGTGMDHPSIPDAIRDFKSISDPLVAWVQAKKPKGWEVIHCSVADASWVQKKGEEIKNPFSDEMRSCGERSS